jgi:hypothetical protein
LQTKRLAKNEIFQTVWTLGNNSPQTITDEDFEYFVKKLEERIQKYWNLRTNENQNNKIGEKQ